jgi:hypothetical protein
MIEAQSVKRRRSSILLVLARERLVSAGLAGYALKGVRQSISLSENVLRVARMANIDAGRQAILTYASI